MNICARGRTAERVSVILPAYNEGEQIATSVHEVHRVMSNFCDDFEIVVVDDGSDDDTLTQAREAAEAYPNVKVLTNTSNQGKGWALREGSFASSGERVVFLDADLDIHPVQIRLLFDIMRQTSADVVIGSKRHPQSQLEYPMTRRILSAGYFFLVKFLFGLPIRDTQTGLKLFRAEVLRAVLPLLVVKQFAFDLELLAVAHRKGYRISEAPIVLKQLRIKLRPVGVRSVRNIWVDTMGILYRLRVMQYYDRYPNVTPEESKGFGFWQSMWLALRCLYRRIYVEGEGIPWWILWRR